METLPFRIKAVIFGAVMAVYWLAPTATYAMQATGGGEAACHAQPVSGDVGPSIRLR